LPLWCSTPSILPEFSPRRIGISAAVHPEWIGMVRPPGLA
jgi:hypothetical protein